MDMNECDELSLEQLSEKILLVQRQQQEACEQTYYQRLAQQDTMTAEEQEELHIEVMEQVGQLKHSAGNFTQACQRTLVFADELETRLKEGKSSGKKRRIFRAAPANSVIDLQEQGSFAQGLNLYKIALLLIIGSFAGVIVEMLWCFVWHGYMESRAGLVYGPFNLLYGVGALVLTVALYRFRNRSSIYSFLGGMLVGSVLEYACSWGQEMLFGSTSWDYSSRPFNLDGRICLQYAVYWGILGVMWMKNLYPRVAKWILKLPNHHGKLITRVLVVFMVCNGIMTLFAVQRWSERIYHRPKSGVVDEFLDQHFPDERMEYIFANMKFD